MANVTIQLNLSQDEAAGLLQLLRHAPDTCVTDPIYKALDGFVSVDEHFRHFDVNFYREDEQYFHNGFMFKVSKIK